MLLLAKPNIYQGSKSFLRSLPEALPCISYKDLLYSDVRLDIRYRLHRCCNTSMAYSKHFTGLVNTSQMHIKGLVLMTGICKSSEILGLFEEVMRARGLRQGLRSTLVPYHIYS